MPALHQLKTMLHQCKTLSETTMSAHRDRLHRRVHLRHHLLALYRACPTLGHHPRRRPRHHKCLSSSALVIVVVVTVAAPVQNKRLLSPHQVQDLVRQTKFQKQTQFQLSLEKQLSEVQARPLSRLQRCNDQKKGPARIPRASSRMQKQLQKKVRMLIQSCSVSMA